ncbi:MAG: lipopolysaccharide assembly protein LapB [Legionella sp.]
MINLWPLLLPAAAWSGWWIARRHYSNKRYTLANQLSSEYMVGLNYLLNEQPDKAVDVFIKLLEVGNDTVETHLALGSLFRRRGEVDRAIRIHQNLISRTQLNPNQRKEALLALGQDYMSAGVFDRAERLFKEVVDVTHAREVNSLQGLLAIYQQEKAWLKALDIIDKLENATGCSMHIQSAHYYCEIALLAIKSEDFEQVTQAINQALFIDKSSVRANLIQADLAINNQQYEHAIGILKCIPVQDPEFSSEIVEPLVYCYQQLNQMEECINYLTKIMSSYPCTSIIFIIGDYIRGKNSTGEAIDFISSQLSRYPSIRGLNRLILWYLDYMNGNVRDKLQMLYDITSKFLADKPIYRCSHCGFNGKFLYWQCPSCKHWGRIKPIHGLEGA